MKKIITYLSLACMSTLSLAQNSTVPNITVQQVWAGMIKNGQHLGTSGIESDDNGNTYAVMTLKGEVDFDLKTTESKVDYGGVNGGALVKYDENGALVWKNTLQGSDNRSYNVALGPNGNVFVSGIYKGSLKVNGVTKLNSNGNWNGYIIKFNSSGVYSSGKSLTSTGDTRIHGLEIDNQGSVYVSGYTSSPVELRMPSLSITTPTPTSGKVNSFVAKYNTSFIFLWGASMSGAVDVHNRALTIGGSNVYIGGYVEKASTSSVIVKKIGGVTQRSMTGSSNASDGYVIVLDKATGDPKHIEKIVGGPLSTNRVRVFDVKYSNTDNSVLVLSDYSGDVTADNASIIGNSNDSKRAGLVQKYSVSTGSDLLTFDWSQSLIHYGTTVTTPMTIRDLDVDQTNGNIAIAAETRLGLYTAKNEAGVRKTAVIVSTEHQTNNDGFSIVYDKRGNFVQHLFFGGGLGNCQVVTLNKDVITVAGWYRGTVNLDVTDGSNSFDGGSFNSIGLAQHTILGGPLDVFKNNDINNDVQVSPNPASDRVSISLNDVINVSVLNTKGEVVLETKSNTFDVSSFKSGVYVLKVQTEEGLFVQKLVKE